MKSLGNVLDEAVKQPNSVSQRMATAVTFQWLCRLTALCSILVLAVLLYTVFSKGFAHLSWSFLTSSPHPDPTRAGIWPALMGTFWTCAACGFLTLPIGIGTAIFLEEFRPRNRYMRWLHALVELNIANLAGVPSVVYGIVGLAAFVSMFGLMDQSDNAGQSKPPFIDIGSRYYDQFLTLDDRVVLVPVDSNRSPDTALREGLEAIDQDGKPINLHLIAKGESAPDVQSERVVAIRWNETPGRVHRQSWYHFTVPFGHSVLAGSLTLMLVILPVVIISSQEAFRAIPPSLREAALGIGATSWQAVWNVTLPAAIPGIMTGAILAMSRAIGEAAPIMMISGIVFITRAPSNLMSVFTVLSLQIYDWAGRHEAGFHAISAAAIIVLLLLLLVFNSIAIVIRQKFSQP
ncbi:MAG: PstA family ABC transporter permease [Pirellulaceae bacterium]|nr:PstA family ABC transporter permease [Pirellulaceae bacterium]